MSLDEAGGDEFVELGLEGGAVRSCLGGGLAVGEGFAGVEQGGELSGQWRGCGLDCVEAWLEAGDLPADVAEEKNQPCGPVCIGAPPCGLGAAEGEVVGFLVFLDDAFQRTSIHPFVPRQRLIE